MRFVDEYRGEAEAQQLLRAIERVTTRSWTLMEICGGQTHTLVKAGIDQLLPPAIQLVHGPGCPVCVTPLELIDRALAIAARPDVLFTSFGDMLRVPGSHHDLLSIKAAGGDIRIVYSPLDAVKLAQKHPDRQVVFFAVGFETTAPANAMAVHLAHQLGLDNFSILCAHVLVPRPWKPSWVPQPTGYRAFSRQAMYCAVMGYHEYLPIADLYQVPIVVTGFEPLDLLQGIYMTLEMLEQGQWGVENQYARAVTVTGNRHAQQLMSEIFEVRPRQWRGIGTIPQSGLGLRPAYAAYDAELRFEVTTISAPESPLCIAGQIMQGHARPGDCSAFGSICTPEHPLGAPMVSSEGACAAYFHYHRQSHDT